MAQLPNLQKEPTLLQGHTIHTRTHTGTHTGASVRPVSLPSPGPELLPQHASAQVPDRTQLAEQVRVGSPGACSRTGPAEPLKLRDSPPPGGSSAALLPSPEVEGLPGSWHPGRRRGVPGPASAREERVSVRTGRPGAARPLVSGSAHAPQLCYSTLFIESIPYTHAHTHRHIYRCTFVLIIKVKHLRR